MNDSSEYNNTVVLHINDVQYITLLQEIMYYYYCTVCAVGIPGNVSVIIIVSCILLRLSNENTHMYIYLFSLSLTDLIDLLGITTRFLQSQSYLISWILCKTLVFCEIFGKILSSWYLIVLSFDRYIAICRPTWAKLRTVKFSLVALFLVLLCCSVTLGPQVHNAAPVSVNVANGGNISAHWVCKTVASADKFWNKGINLCVTLLGFVLPVALIIYFYSVLWKLISHSRHMSRSQIPLKRVTCFTVLLVIFYLVCGTPYWILNLLRVFESLGPFRAQLGYGGYIIAYYILINLYHINSALNWILYSLLNKELREKAEEAIPIHPPTCGQPNLI